MFALIRRSGRKRFTFERNKTGLNVLSGHRGVSGVNERAETNI